MKTKIVVLHLKEVLFTTLFAILGMLFIAMLILLFMPNGATKSLPSSPKDAIPQYQDGTYTTPVSLGNDNFQIQFQIEKGQIISVEFLELSKELKTMYPLLIPALEDISKQLLQTQSLDELVYPDDRKYTSLILINALKEGLKQALP